MTPAIRPARTGDLEALLDLWDALMANGRDADPRYAPTPDARVHMRPFVEQTWLARDPFPHALVADDDGLVGYVTAWPLTRLPVVDLAPTVRIGDMYVAPSHRGHGVGRALVTEMLRRTAAAGFPRTEVGTLTADARAVAFWRAVGFADWQISLVR